MSDITYPLYPICAFIGFVLVLIPLPSHVKAWNTATVWFMIWTALACLSQFVNSVVWRGNVVNHAPIWCDISTRIVVGAQVGIPASCLSINRRLFSFTRLQTVSVSRSMKLRAALVDTSICLVVPLVCIAMAYIVQGHRFDILEDVGCYVAIYNTIPSYFLVFTPPLLVGFSSLIFGGLTLAAFTRRRAEVIKFASSSSGMTMSRYFRLIALTLTEMSLNMPLEISAIVLNSRLPIEPWISWEDTHFDYGRVGQIPAVLWRSDTLNEARIEFTRWVAPFCAFVFFIFFGFSEDARRRYVATWKFVDSRTRISKILQRRPSRFRPLLSHPSAEKATLPTHTESSAPKDSSSSVIHLTVPRTNDQLRMSNDGSDNATDELCSKSDYPPVASSFAPSTLSPYNIDPGPPSSYISSAPPSPSSSISRHIRRLP